MLSAKDYCDYETSVALKELGYPLFSKEVRYEENAVFVPGVLLYAAQKWLREERNLHIEVCYNPSISWYYYHVWKGQDEIAEGDAFPSYEDALSTAIYMAVEYLKNESNGK